MTNTSTEDNELIEVFCWGANADGGMLEAMVGRKFEESEGELITVPGYRLCTQKLSQMKDNKAKQIVKKSWDDAGEAFESYFIKRDDSSTVTGRIFKLTKKEYSRMNNWELVNGAEGGMPVGQGMQDEETFKFLDKDGKERTLKTQVLLDDTLSVNELSEEQMSTNEYGYELFLRKGNFKKHILELAERNRVLFDKENDEKQKPKGPPVPRMR